MKILPKKDQLDSSPAVFISECSHMSVLINEQSVPLYPALIAAIDGACSRLCGTVQHKISHNNHVLRLP